MAARPDTVAPSRLGALARRSTGAREAALERCELCGTPIAARHPHLLRLSDREIVCSCKACSLLFDKPGTEAGRHRLVPDRRLRIDDLALDDVTWEQLRLPVDIAFLFRDTAAGRMQAFYPSPMGPTESLLALDAWDGLVADNPVLGTLEPDVEALLVHRARGARRQWLVPIDECYALVGLIRTRWRGLTGGTEVWHALGEFFDDLDRRSRSASRHGPHTSAALAAAERGPDG